MAKRDKDGLSVGYERNYKGLQDIVESDNPVSATIEMALKRGRPSNYPCTPQGLETFMHESKRYLDFVNEKNLTLEKQLVLDIEGWAVFLGTTRTTINTYQKRGGEWTEFICWFKELIASQKKQAMFTYAIPPVVGIFDLKNNHGYTDKTEVEMDITQAKERGSIDAQLQEVGLVWNESTQSFEPMEG